MDTLQFRKNFNVLPISRRINFKSVRRVEVDMPFAVYVPGLEELLVKCCNATECIVFLYPGPVFGELRLPPLPQLAELTIHTQEVELDSDLVLWALKGFCEVAPALNRVELDIFDLTLGILRCLQTLPELRALTLTLEEDFEVDEQVWNGFERVLDKVELWGTRAFDARLCQAKALCLHKVVVADSFVLPSCVQNLQCRPVDKGVPRDFFTASMFYRLALVGPVGNTASFFDALDRMPDLRHITDVALFEDWVMNRVCFKALCLRIPHVKNLVIQLESDCDVVPWQVLENLQDFARTCLPKLKRVLLAQDERRFSFPWLPES